MLKLTRTFVGLLLLTLSSIADARQLFYSPGFCDPQRLKLVLENKTSQTQTFWTQTAHTQGPHEKSFQVGGKSTMTLVGSRFLTDKSAFSIKTSQKNALAITADCEDSIQFPLQDLTSLKVTHHFSTNVRTVKVYLLNLFIQANDMKLKAYGMSGNFLGERQVTLSKYYETNTFKWRLPQTVARIEVEGDQRLSSVILYDDHGIEKSVPPKVSAPAPLNADPRKTYFLVSTKEMRPNEGFVIALEDQKMIDIARDQIRFKDLEKIVVAGIELGNGGYNRAFYSKDRSPYSWSVYRVDAFADFAYIDCDGSPDLIEERLMQRLNEGGRICFWRYRVTRELNLQEVNSGNITP
jgi:hypothetical protein